MKQGVKNSLKEAKSLVFLWFYKHFRIFKGGGKVKLAAARFATSRARIKGGKSEPGGGGKMKQGGEK